MSGLKYIGPVFDGCYHPQTKVLTKRGWKTFSELTKHDLIATLTPEMQLEYNYPIRIIEKDWEGELLTVRSEEGEVLLRVTPDHSMILLEDSRLAMTSAASLSGTFSIPTAPREHKRHTYLQFDSLSRLLLALDKCDTEPINNDFGLDALLPLIDDVNIAEFSYIVYDSFITRRDLVSIISMITHIPSLLYIADHLVNKYSQGFAPCCSEEEALVVTLFQMIGMSCRWDRQLLIPCADSSISAFIDPDPVPYVGKVVCAEVPNHTMLVRFGDKAVWCGNSGYAEAARNYVLAIHEQGYPITLTPISFEKTRPDLGEEGKILRSLVGKNIPYDKILVHSTPDLWSQLWSREDENIYRIGYTVWETDRLHPIWTVACNDPDEVWTACDWNVEVFHNSNVHKPVYKIPHALPKRLEITLPRAKLAGIPDDAYVFYSIFQWQERKDPYALLASYYAAFSGVDDVFLVLKTYMRDQGGDKDAIRRTIQDFRKQISLPHYPKIFLVVENLSSEQMAALHASGDCYVAFPHSEAWGLGTFEAAAQGNPVLTTGYGGCLEYLNNENSYLVGYQLAPVVGMPWSPYYRADQRWANVNQDEAVDLFRHIYNNREEAADKGKKARGYILSNFSREKIGKLIVERLSIIDEGRACRG